MRREGRRLWDITQSSVPPTDTPSPLHKRGRMDAGSTDTAPARTIPGALRATQRDVPEPPGWRRPHLTPRVVTPWAAPDRTPATLPATTGHLTRQPQRRAANQSAPIAARQRETPQPAPAPTKPDQAQAPDQPSTAPPSASLRTRPSVAPGSDPLLPATLPGTATERHAEPRPAGATRTRTRWTPTHAPMGSCCAQQYQTQAGSRLNRLTRQNF